MLSDSSETKNSQTDPCGRCGCERRFHNPPKSYSYAKTGSSSGKSHMIEIKARTCCDSCPHCFCFCIAWIEPFEGQPYKECVYARHNLPEVQYTATNDRKTENENRGTNNSVLSGVLNNRKARRAALQRGKLNG